MDRGRIVLREKVTENAPLATLFEEETQEKPEVDCVCPKAQEKFHLLTGPLDSVLQFFFHENGLVNSYLNRNR